MADSIIAKEETPALYRVPGRYKLDEVTGEPMPMNLTDEALCRYDEGCARGHELALELFNWLPQFDSVLHEQGVIDAHGCAADRVRTLIEQACQILAQPKTERETLSHRGIAVGFLDAISGAVVSALAQPTAARRNMEKLRDDFAAFTRANPLND